MSDEEDLGTRVGKALEADDVVGLETICREFPDLLEPSSAISIAFDAAGMGAARILVWSIAKGISVNASQSFSSESIVERAANADRLDIVRWLIDHGCELNYEYDDKKVRCWALNYAVLNGNLEMVKLLVESGAMLNVLDRNNCTPLSWAIQHIRPAIADYLRSKGGLEAHQIPGCTPPEKKSPLAQWLENRGLYTPRLTWLPLVSDPMSVAVRWVDHDNFRGLITDGMSSRPMNVPAGQEAYRYAELLLLLTDVSSPQELQQSPHQWTINWLQQLAQYPFEHSTWLGAPVTIVANGDPPEPLAPGVAMTCWLLCAHKPPLTRAKLSDGKEVVFYTVLPIHTAERDFERDHGAAALLHRFAQKNVPEHFVAERPSAI